MFYSHQLLARKAPLGQIWMAATMHAKINRRKLDKLNIIKICEEILNPSVPMALRLSGILMGGVVIVYERKVKLLYDDVHRLLVEINEAWKVKARADPTVLPKGKTQAKYEAVTLKDDNGGEMEAGDHEQALHYSSTTAETTRIPNASYFPMGLDYVSETYININPDEDNLTQDHHQDVPLSDEIKDPRQEPQDHQQPDGFRNIAEKRRPTKRKTRPRTVHIIMDDELTIIPGNIYQSWLHDASDIVSRRGRRKKRLNPLLSMKTSDLMELPPVALISSLANVTGEIYYPKPLLELWRKSTRPQTAHDSPSRRMSPPQPPKPSWPSPPKRAHPQDPPEFPMEDFQSGTGFQQFQPSIEKLRNNLGNIEQEALEEALKVNQFATPGSSEYAVRSIPSSGSGHSFLQMDAEVQLHSGRSKKRQHSSSSGHSLGGLDPVDEEIPWRQKGRDPKLKRLSENGLTPDLELLEETAPTQTANPMSEPSMNEITRSIKTHLKLHFDTPGAPQVESLDQLASGMNRRKAAQLFYQTCVLASSDFLRVEQTVAYGDISISRGPKM
ncbi:sister chromatid cohesion 1 protein 1 [Magnolia sinica]|uniref:sister chromatid cohesion 1 protein 1 n=1 Tax=Magnolia sinica TaxID=86752 RepID=UPI00265A2E96|nr:sister chromatid cohesion 1 protein 1 [Magnolia sinica]